MYMYKDVLTELFIVTLMIIIRYPSQSSRAGLVM